MDSFVRPTRQRHDHVPARTRRPHSRARVSAHRSLDDPRTREIVISSADATGLGVDIARVLFAFGLSVFFCDLTADNLWAYLVFRVRESDDRVDWVSLAEKLEATCPSDGDALAAMSHIAAVENEPFVVKVSGFDRPGLLWRISRAFWQLDCSVFKAHVSTDEHGNALDSFWIHDNTGRLPSPSRALEITDHLVELLGENVDVSIIPAPSQTQVVPKNISVASGFTFFEGERLRRLACKDATSHSNLRSLVIKNHVAQKHWSSSDSLSSSRSGSGSFEDMLMFPLAGGLHAGGHTAHRSSGSDVFNNDMSNRHKRMSSILMESPEKQVDVVSGDVLSSSSFDGGAVKGCVNSVTDGIRSLGLSDASDLSPPGSAGAAGAVDNNLSVFAPTTTSMAMMSASSVTREIDDLKFVSIEADTHTSSEYIILTIKCQNRKGILYDIFVQLKEIRVRVASCRTWMLDDDSGRVCVELMVQDAYGGDVCSPTEEDSTQVLVERMREAIAKSVTIALGCGRRDGQYKLIVVAMVDAGGRGRPRVTYDVTKLFSVLGLSITECEVFVEEGILDEDESFEVHKYVFEPNMRSLRLTDGDKHALSDAVAHSLQGREGDLPRFEYISSENTEHHQSKQKCRAATVPTTAVPTSAVHATAVKQRMHNDETDSWLRLVN